MSSWHFLLIVMTTDSMVFHWIWTGINVDDKLWVTMNSIFYLRPVLSLLWLHLSLWLLLLPAHDYCVISASHGSVCTRENGTLHQYRPFLIQCVSFGLLIKTVILLMLHSTPFALWTSQWNRICEWSVIVLSTTNKRMISLSLTCQRNTTCNLYCFQNNTQVSYSNIFPLFLGYNHPTKSTSFSRVFKTIMHWYHRHITYLQLESHHGTVLFILSTLTSCSRSIW